MSVRSQSPSLLLGTRNAGKLREIETILAGVPWQLHSLKEFAHVGVADETAPNYAENAIAKAQFYARETGLCALADDSGLEVGALDGAPGVYSARYAGEGASDADRRAFLLSELARFREKDEFDRRARFVCVVAVATPDCVVLNTSEGVCEGRMILTERGTHGFGYDPLFVPNGFDQTFAELSDSIKNQISHRARALLKTKHFLLSHGAQLDQESTAS